MRVLGSLFQQLNPFLLITPLIKCDATHKGYAECQFSVKLIASDMTHQLGTPAKHDLSLTPAISMIEGENQLQNVIL